ncbi:hypothetical protein [Geomicrobium sediminis]|uniref:Uncharacterized protein n=1 Tax=Geomicrobium sediminis TaxID=1347788 RepID=A0ABS2PFV8_9BACL|nr:hypothetical protein [Geomicrobium sediminis]MBM7634214.1 hypothetical protein [Geomicrobium sediminis]
MDHFEEYDPYKDYDNNRYTHTKIIKTGGFIHHSKGNLRPDTENRIIPFKEIA